MDIPESLASKFSPYEVQFHGKKVTTYVAYNHDEINRYLKVIDNLIQKKQHRIVGVDIKKDEKDANKLLILCISSHCLVIQAHYVDSLPRLLKELMDDSSICFVSDKNVIGTSLIINSSYVGDGREIFKVKGTELGFLAARMRKNPDLLEVSGGLSKIADAFGVEMPDMKDIKPPNWGASVFSEDQMKIVIHDAYMRFLIAAKSLGVNEDC